jgi:hypothetical protein
MGEWRTERWLCEMRKRLPGDDAFLLAHKGQGRRTPAKGDARGRSVELVHQVLSHWLCFRPDVAARVAAPTGDRYTPATAAVVREFQKAFSEERDGIVGPGTLQMMDWYINGKPVPPPEDCGGGGGGGGGADPCPEREPDEAAASARAPLVLEAGAYRPAGPDGAEQFVSLIGFTTDDSTLDKGPEKALDDLGEILDADARRPKRNGTAYECWQAESFEVTGFADCHEEPSLGLERAERLRDEFPESDIAIELAPRPATRTQLSALDRRRNRSLLIRIFLRRADRVDFAGSLLDDLLAEARPNRAALEARGWRPETIRLGELLAADTDPDSLDLQFIDWDGANKTVGLNWPDECDDWFEDFEWTSPRRAVARALANARGDPTAFCAEGIVPVLDDLMWAIERHAVKPMEAGVSRLIYWQAHGGIASVSAGCPCEAVNWLATRAKQRGDIYHLIEGQSVWEEHTEVEPCGT